jgi:hypothetical protein
LLEPYSSPINPNTDLRGCAASDGKTPPFFTVANLAAPIFTDELDGGRIYALQHVCASY